MIEWFTTDRICDLLANAESLGINTIFARTDDRVISNLTEYWRRGGTIQWFAQVSGSVREDDRPENSWQSWLTKGAEAGATALYCHGGITDFWHANGHNDRFTEFAELARGHGRVVGFAGHRPATHEWIRDKVDADFQMCSYYNPTDRSASPHHISHGESWVPEHRDEMAAVIETIHRPVVHYKVFGGGNMPADDAFAFMGRTVRPTDLVLLGIFPKDDPDLLAKDVAMFEEQVEGRTATLPTTD
jgi:hypothetical protein